MSTKKQTVKTQHSRYNVGSYTRSMSEKQQKTGEEGLEIDQMIAQLDEKHQAKLKDILGAHYEAVRDHYDQYMESAQ